MVQSGLQGWGTQPSGLEVFPSSAFSRGLIGPPFADSGPIPPTFAGFYGSSGVPATGLIAAGVANGQKMYCMYSGNFSAAANLSPGVWTALDAYTAPVPPNYTNQRLGAFNETVTTAELNPAVTWKLTGTPVATGYSMIAVPAASALLSHTAYADRVNIVFTYPDVTIPQLCTAYLHLYGYNDTYTGGVSALFNNLTDWDLIGGNKSANFLETRLYKKILDPGTLHGLTITTRNDLPHTTTVSAELLLIS